MDDVPDRAWVQRALNVHQMAQVHEALGLTEQCRQDVDLLREMLAAMPKAAFVETMTALGYDPKTGRRLTPQRLCINCRASPEGDVRSGVTDQGHLFVSRACDSCQRQVDREIERIREIAR